MPQSAIRTDTNLVLLLCDIKCPGQGTHDGDQLVVYNLHAETVATTITKNVMVDDVGILCKGFLVGRVLRVQVPIRVEFLWVGVHGLITSTRPLGGVN